MANDWRGSWLAFEFRRDRGGEERGIERCEAVSASSSSDSRNTTRDSEPVGEGGGNKLETMIDEVGDSQVMLENYVITGLQPFLAPSAATQQPATGLAMTRTNRSRPFVPYLSSTITMSLFLLCLLLYPVIASPVDSLRSQAILTLSEKSKSELGWFDPRERGGQFLDVSKAD